MHGGDSRGLCGGGFAPCAAPSSDWRSGQALSRGYRVRATVRDETDPERCEWMWNLPAYKSGRLTIHAADLDNPGCFDEIFKGCNGVLHVSHVSDYADDDYVRATCEHIGARYDNDTITHELLVYLVVVLPQPLASHIGKPLSNQRSQGM